MQACQIHRRKVGWKVILLRSLSFYLLLLIEKTNFSSLNANKKAHFRALLDFSAERTLPFSNLKPLNGLENKRLQNAISPHKIERANGETVAEILSRDLAAINDFLYYVEAEPFVTPEKGQNSHRVAFKKTA